MDDISYTDFERLAKSHEDLSAHVVALTAVGAAIPRRNISTTSRRRFDRPQFFRLRYLEPHGVILNVPLRHYRWSQPMPQSAQR
jgi:hypothetical protein